MDDTFYMQLALNKAWHYQGRTYPNPAVGAVVVCKGEIVAIEAHQKAGCSHAEVLGLISAYEKISNHIIDFDPQDATLSHAFLRSLPKDFFASCCIYVTLEPCSHHGKTPSCASLLSHLNFARVIIGIKDPILGHNGGSQKLKNVTIGVLEEACNTLIEPFLIWQHRAFVLFKLAQTTNGRIASSENDGYLSTHASLTHVHQLRSVCSTLLIGGNTVREDRPTLDCRFTQAKAPNIKIYTHQEAFDTTIALFNVPQREVILIDTLDFLDTPSFVMVEGGEGMLNALKDKIDWVLLYHTPKLSKHHLSYNAMMNLEFLHSEKKDVDLAIWSRSLGY